jgi:hypothetical protein
MKRSIALGCVLAMAPALAGAESNTDKFNAGLKPILTQSAQVQMALSCRFVSGSIAQSAAMKMTTEMDALIAHVWGIGPNSTLTGAPADAWRTGMQQAEAAGATALSPTNAECRAFKSKGGVDAVKATFGGG